MHRDMDSMYGLREPLVADRVILESWISRFTKGFARRVLKCRFPNGVHEDYGFEDKVEDIAWPTTSLSFLSLAMLLSTAGALYHLGGMSGGMAPRCEAFECQSWRVFLTIEDQS